MPPKPPTDQQETARSAAAFGEYVGRTVQYAAHVRDVTPMIVLARDQAACSTCRQLSDYIEGLKRDGVWETGDDLVFDRVRATPTPTGFRVRGEFTYPPIRFVDVHGEEDSSQRSTPYTLSVDLAWDDQGSRWRVEDYSFLKKK
jgi:hypothetical protein